MRLLPCGDLAVLLEVDEVAPGPASRQVAALARALAADPPGGLDDLVPGARTLLVRVRTPADLVGVTERLATWRPDEDEPARCGDPVVVPVVYDGADLDEVAQRLDLTAAEVVAAHTGADWRVAFTGFAPGFGYLLADGDPLAVPRRDTPRARVPAGAVGLAGPFSGVYPSASPGGWQLLGRTDLALFDPARRPPALLVPGARVRFEAVP